MFSITPRRKQWSGNIPEEISSFLSLPNWARMDWMQDLFHNNFRVDIIEEGSEYLLQAELPGVPKENISIEIDNDYLTISVRQESTETEKDANYIRRERKENYSKRSFYIGEIEPENIQAKFRDGVLEIRLPNISAGPDNKRSIDIQ